MWHVLQLSYMSRTKLLLYFSENSLLFCYIWRTFIFVIFFYEFFSFKVKVDQTMNKVD